MAGLALCGSVTCPNPTVFVTLGDPETFPVSWIPHLPDSSAFGREQIPQVSVIMLQVPENVHGACLKPYELI